MSLMKAALRWVRGIPAAVAHAREDLAAVRANDPAARTMAEVVLFYPGVHALWMHRIAHDLWTNDAPLSARALAHLNRFVTGIEIHPGATIGRRVFIDHGMGIVIGETATIGDDCILYKGVVLGGVSLARTIRHPQLKSGVVVGSNACILGAIDIGEGARIGSGSVVVRPVPPGATVVGVPARVIVPAKHRFDAALDHANLPDPVQDMIRALVAQNEKLRTRVEALENKLDIAHVEEPTFLPYEGEELPPADGG
jgi:serine O-acetyltransferase